MAWLTRLLQGGHLPATHCTNSIYNEELLAGVCFLFMLPVNFTCIQVVCSPAHEVHRLRAICRMNEDTHDQAS